MATIRLEDGTTFDCAADDVLLRAGLRAGLGLPYECNAGGCGTCKIEVLEGEVEVLWPEAPGLSERDRRKGRQLACQCRPKGDCSIKVRLDVQCQPQVPPQRRSAQLVGVRGLTHDIRELQLHVPGCAAFLPGQYALIGINGQYLRAYSMANLANSDGIWHFQVRRVPKGQATSLLFDDAQLASAQLTLDGPYGLAYLRNTGRDLVCVAGGSGLAPMLSVARGVASDPAMADRRVWFFHGGRTTSDLFSTDQMRDWTGLGDRLDYIPATSEADQGGLRHGFIHEVMQAELGYRLGDFELYCAGPPPMVQALERLAHNGGLAPSQIHFDRFF